jgi:hypothetical protein
MSKADDYRRLADQCEEIAAVLSDGDAKREQYEHAQKYRRLAELETLGSRVKIAASDQAGLSHASDPRTER